MGQSFRPAVFRRIEVPLVVAAFLALRALGLIAPITWWSIPVVIVVAATFSDLIARRHPVDGTTRDLYARAAGQTAAIGAVIGLTGWPMAIGYVFSIEEGVQRSGARAVRPAVTCALASLTLSEVAIELGLAPTILPVATSHGLAALSALGLVLAGRVIEQATGAKEQAENEARRREVWFRSLVANASDAIIVFGPGGTVSYTSPSLEHILDAGEPGDGRLSTEAVHPDDRDRARTAMREFLAAGRIPVLELRLLDENGDWRWFEIMFTNRLEDPDIGGIIANLRDVTERKEAEQRLTHQAFHDALTGLPNRPAFVEALRERLVDPSAVAGEVAVLFLDIDRFKVVNDSLGHECGDHLLNVVAQRVRAKVGPSDLVARFGGDEFTVLLGTVAGEAKATAVAEKILDGLRSPTTVLGHELLTGASIGVAVWDGDPDTDGDELLRRADFAMYLAKERGRSRCEVFDPSHAPAIQDRLELEAELLRALRNDQLMVHFQPVISLATGETVGAEALARWHHPVRGNVPPDQFIPLAEDTGLILDVDRYVLATSCRHAAGWNRSRAADELLRVSVNLSPQFVHQTDAAEQVLEALDQAGADPAWLQIEITERTALGNRTRTVETLQRLRRRGIRVAIDDFGTGYSSLSYLRTFPIDVLKLDPSFVGDIDQRSSGAAIVEAVIGMGHSLGMHVTAEGVERDEQTRMLMAWGCDTVQGYRFSPAVPAEELVGLMHLRSCLPVPV